MKRILLPIYVCSLLDVRRNYVVSLLFTCRKNVPASSKLSFNVHIIYKNIIMVLIKYHARIYHNNNIQLPRSRPTKIHQFGRLEICFFSFIYSDRNR